MKSYLTRALAVIAIVIVGGFASMGCRTVQGAGADIQNVGEAMEDAVH